MKIPLFSLEGQYRQIRPGISKRIRRIFESHRFILGENVRKLEAAVAKKVGARYAIGVASGSDALYLSLVALGIGKGDEVITTPFTFFATAGAIARTGAKPVFADIDPETFNINPTKIRKRITRKTKAILPVHLFGLPCEMDEITQIAKKHKLFVVEDAAQSFGAEYRGRQTGSMGAAGCFSFYPTKNLGGAGDGGMVVTSLKKVASKLRTLRDHGQTKKYHHEFSGINSRLDEIQAAVLLEKLPYIDRWNRQRRAHAAAYNRGLKGLPLQLPAQPKGLDHVYHLYSILTKKRDPLLKALVSGGIGAGVYYPLPLHLQPCMRALGYRRGDFPHSESASEQIVALPMFPELKLQAVRKVVSAAKIFFSA
ncbi:MAG: transcriptional regulator [Omnitrophica bacterium RIFCSPHIGHO2_02_FULL_51_18]|nr:MAG: transcriptional regulator [Omnitrophica bacterium RIFCSPHIGHO2_02_FULL_51_18]